MDKVEQRDCPKRVGGACGVTLRSTSTVLFDPFWPPCASQIHAHSVALTPFRTVSELDFVHLVRVRRGRVRSSPVRHREVMMRTLPSTMLHLLNPFVPLFSRRLWPHVQVLL